MFDVKSTYCTMRGCTVQTGEYGNGTLAVILTDGQEQDECVSINLQEHGLVPAERQFYVKNYAEHEGLAIALMQAGIATKIGEVEFGPYESSATLMELKEGIA